MRWNNQYRNRFIQYCPLAHIVLEMPKQRVVLGFWVFLRGENFHVFQKKTIDTCCVLELLPQNYYFIFSYFPSNASFQPDCHLRVRQWNTPKTLHLCTNEINLLSKLQRVRPLLLQRSPAARSPGAGDHTLSQGDNSWDTSWGCLVQCLIKRADAENKLQLNDGSMQIRNRFGKKGKFSVFLLAYSSLDCLWQDFHGKNSQSNKNGQQDT